MRGEIRKEILDEMPPAERVAQRVIGAARGVDYGGG